MSNVLLSLYLCTPEALGRCLLCVTPALESSGTFSRDDGGHLLTSPYLCSFTDPLIGHMEMVTEIVVPTVCTLCILLTAVFFMFLLRGRL